MKLYKPVDTLINTADDIDYDFLMADINYSYPHDSYYVRSTDYMFSLYVNRISLTQMAYYCCPHCNNEFFLKIGSIDTVKTIETKLQDQISEHKKLKKECRGK